MSEPQTVTVYDFECTFDINQDGFGEHIIGTFGPDGQLLYVAHASEPELNLIGHENYKFDRLMRYVEIDRNA